MTRPKFLRKFIAFLVLLLLLGSGCLSPTLPQPPPGPPDITTVSAEGTVTLRGRPGNAQDGALIFGLVQRTGEGAITTANAQGAWTMILGLTAPVRPKDRITVWQQIDGIDSSPVDIAVPEDDSIDIEP